MPCSTYNNINDNVTLRNFLLTQEPEGPEPLTYNQYAEVQKSNPNPISYNQYAEVQKPIPIPISYNQYAEVQKPIPIPISYNQYAEVQKPISYNQYAEVQKPMSYNQYAEANRPLEGKPCKGKGHLENEWAGHIHQGVCIEDPPEKYTGSSLFCAISLPTYPLSPDGSYQNTQTQDQVYFSVQDADPIIQGHEIYWLVCVETYNKKRLPRIAEAWYLIYHDVESCIYQNRCEIIVGFRGTNRAKDLYDDTKLTLGMAFPRHRQAVVYLKTLLSVNTNVIAKVTGHSLGGAIAREVSKTMKLECVTFNAAAPPSTPVVHAEKETGYHIVFDVISAWQGPGTIRIDKGYWPLTTVYGMAVPYAWIWHVLNGVKDSHSLDNFSKKRVGKVVSAETETLLMRKWFKTLPIQGRVFIMSFLMGVRMSPLADFPAVE